MMLRLGLTKPGPAGPPEGGGGGGGVYDGGGGTVGSLIEASPFRKGYRGTCSRQSTQRDRGPPELRERRHRGPHGCTGPAVPPRRIPPTPARLPVDGSIALQLLRAHRESAGKFAPSALSGRRAPPPRPRGPRRRRPGRVR